MKEENPDHLTIPIWAYEAIEIEDANMQWEAYGLRETRELSDILSKFDIKGAEHIGSTAVPGLPAKPIIDVMIRIESFDMMNAIVDTLTAYGWHYVPPELDGKPWRRFFVKVKDDKRVAHLHLMKGTAKRWEERIEFRDKLRESPLLAKEYGLLKKQLATEFREDREKYTEAKAEFINRVLNS